jgi:DNA-binding PadR family transcriptional regulator
MEQIGTYDRALEDLIRNGLIEQLGEGKTATYRLSTKGRTEGKRGSIGGNIQSTIVDAGNDTNRISFVSQHKQLLQS